MTVAVVEFRILGPVEVVTTRPVPPLGPKQRTLLAVLLVHAGEVVTVAQLVDYLWGERPPTYAVNLLRGYVSDLRKSLGLQRSDGAGLPSLVTRPPGYVLRVAPGQLDLHVFTEYLRAGREAMGRQDGRGAAEHLRAALELWRGEPFADVDCDLLRDGAGVRLREAWLGAVEDRIEAELLGGRHHDLIPELSGLVVAHPTRERLRGQLMLALYRAGRQVEALAEFRAARGTLIEELGIEPGPALRDLERAILAADPNLAVPVGDAPAPDFQLARPAPVPAQLPADVRAFTGRTGELAVLDRLLSQLGDDSSVPIAVLSGTAGVGKSALAVRWAHRVREEFPDGQLYVNLRGYDAEQPVAAADALAWFLAALGVRGPGIPPAIDERAGRYRSELAGRRMLVLLDNASSVEQVRPLLPGTGSCLVLITSRDSLPGMVAVHGAERLNLDLLPLPDAVGLLHRLIGARVDREPAAAVDLAAACARLPLALRVAAELAAARTDVPLAELVAELADHQRPLDLLDAGGDPHAEVRAVFSWSYQNLPADAARAFRLLGLHPGPTAHVDAAAALTGAGSGEARRLLGLLARASLIQACGGGRYGMHDLLRAYAVELANVHDPTPDRETALTRVFDHYLVSSVAAMNALYPAAAPAVGDPDAARSWIEAERPNLAAACTYGAAHGWHRHAIALAETLFRYLDAGGPVAEAVTVTASAAAAARAIGDRDAQARALTNLGRLHRRQGQLDRAADTYLVALDIYAALGDRAAEAGVLRNLGIVYWRLGHYRQAADHYQQAWTLYGQLGDDAGQADALVRLGLVDERLGDGAQAAARLQSALELFAHLGDRFSEAYVLSRLARLGHHQPDQLELTAVRLEASLAVVRRAGDRTGEAYALTDLAAVHARRGRFAEAAGHLRQAVVLYRRIGDRASEAETLNDLAQVLGAEGNAAEARTEHGEALILAREIGDRYEQARAHDGIAAAYQLGGDLDRAAPHLERAQGIYTDLAVPAAPTVQVPAVTMAVTPGGRRPPTAP